MNRFGSGASRLLPAFILGLALPALTLVGACAGDGDPVARLVVEPNTVELGYGRFEDLEFEWRPIADLGSAAGPVRVFVHLLGDQGRVVRTFDHRLPDDWRPGQPVSYPVRLYQSLLAPALAPGDYILSAGLYDEGGQRWSLETEAEPVARQEYEVARVTIPDRGADGPRLGFSQEWRPAQPGNDRQVVATRRLSGDGSIQVDRIVTAGVLWLEVDIPLATLEAPRVFESNPHAQSQTDENEAGEAATNRRTTGETVELRVRYECSGFESTMTGEGGFQFAIEVAPNPAGSEPCTLDFDANSHLELATDETESDPLVLTLRQLAWRPVS